MEDKSITKFGLKERGWTDKLISIFLPEPDFTKPNPMFRKAPDMCLYYLEKVEEVEQTTDFIDAKSKTELRKTSAKKAVETKIKKTMESIENVSFDVPKISKEKLIKDACQSYNNWNLFKGYVGDVASDKSEPEFLNRICVNKLRHEMTNYDYELDCLFGKVGTVLAYIEIKNRVLDAIAVKYPWLAEECENQKI